MVFDVPRIKRKRVGGEQAEPADKRRSRLLVLIALLVLLCLLSLLYNVYLLNRQERPELRPQTSSPVSTPSVAPEPTATLEPREPVDAASEISGHWYGLAPKNSIHSVEDFRRIVANDPLLTKHFADFNWEKARLGHHPNPVWTHISYRKNDAIRVTRKVIRLPAGDGFITDGNRWVRTYCGNDYVLANAPEPATSPPPRERIDTDLNRLIERADYATRRKEKVDPSEVDPMVVPESGTLPLVVAGAGCLVLCNLYRLHRSKAGRRKVSSGSWS